MEGGGMTVRPGANPVWEDMPSVIVRWNSGEQPYIVDAGPRIHKINVYMRQQLEFEI